MDRAWTGPISMVNTADAVGVTVEDLAVGRLGECTVETPLRELLGGRE